MKTRSHDPPMCRRRLPASAPAAKEQRSQWLPPTGSRASSSAPRAAIAGRSALRPRATTQHQFSWYRFDGLAVGAIIAIWVRSAYFTRRHVWIIVTGWLFLVGIASAATIPYGIFQAKTAAAEALRYTQAPPIRRRHSARVPGLYLPQSPALRRRSNHR
jgi:hypothetical protein